MKPVRHHRRQSDRHGYERAEHGSDVGAGIVSQAKHDRFDVRLADLNSDQLRFDDRELGIAAATGERKIVRRSRRQATRTEKPPLPSTARPHMTHRKCRRTSAASPA